MIEQQSKLVAEQPEQQAPAIENCKARLPRWNHENSKPPTATGNLTTPLTV